MIGPCNLPSVFVFGMEPPPLQHSRVESFGIKLSAFAEFGHAVGGELTEKRGDGIRVLKLGKRRLCRGGGGTTDRLDR